MISSFPHYILGIHPHFLFEALGYLLGLKLYSKAKATGADPYSESERLSLFIFMALGALIGSHVLGAIEKDGTLRFSFHSLLNGKTIVGGLLGGLISVECFKKIFRITRSSGDILVTPVAVGMMLGRIGCFLTGVSDGTVGIPSNSFFAMDMGDGIPRHPTSLYEVVFLTLFVCIYHLILKQYRFPEGGRWAFFCSTYLFFRLVIDELKPKVPLLLNLSGIQVACVLGLIYYLWKMLRRATPRGHIPIMTLL